MNNRHLVVLILFLISVNASAQKVKYKDLILLLTSKQYEKAEPFLKRYLKENDDNPNAYLYMGIIFQEKSIKNDPLTQTEVLCANIDSSLMNYDKAYKTIDDRELRKNDEYYEAYMRRDLRTGKFVIKLSDVQLDVENRTKGLKEKKERVKAIKKYFTESAESYAKANEIYKGLTAPFESEKEFFLRSDDAMIASLQRIITVFDSSVQAFDQYKKISKEIGKTGHDQVLDLQEIKDIKKNGISAADFMKDDLKVWNYKHWASQSTAVIEKEITPLRNSLIAYDIEVNKLQAKLQKDSVSVKNELAHLVSKPLEPLQKFDANPMPVALFNLKIAQLSYQSDVIQNKILHDSADVRLRLAAVKVEMKDIRIVDSLATLLSKRNFETEEKDYKHFITKAFGTAVVLQNTINATLDYAKRERLKREKQWEVTSQSLKWLVTPAADSIPLFMESNRDLKFKPLLIETEKYTFGLSFKDSLATGYFYSITPSRVPDLKVSYPVDQPAFKKRFLPLIKGVAISDGSGNAFITVTYSSQKNKGGKFPVTVAKIYRADGLAWSSNFSFDFLPSGVTINSDTGAISVKVTALDGSEKIMVIDKNGKLTK